jgi:hypothetical protein
MATDLGKLLESSGVHVQSRAARCRPSEGSLKKVIGAGKVRSAGADRDRCITDGYIACGERPRLRVSDRVLEQLAELFRDTGPGGPLPI